MVLDLQVASRVLPSLAQAAAVEDVTLAAQVELVVAAVAVLERQVPQRVQQGQQIPAVVAVHLAERLRLALAVPVQ